MMPSAGDRKNHDPLDGTGREFPARAPMEGTRILNRKPGKMQSAMRRGVRIIGGGERRDKNSNEQEGVKIVDGTNRWRP